jgi:hypothetical protein
MSRRSRNATHNGALLRCFDELDIALEEVVDEIADVDALGLGALGLEIEKLKIEFAQLKRLRFGPGRFRVIRHVRPKLSGVPTMP